MKSCSSPPSLSPFCYLCQLYSHVDADCPEVNLRIITCQNCGVRGHIKGMCPEMGISPPHKSDSITYQNEKECCVEKVTKNSQITRFSDCVEHISIAPNVISEKEQEELENNDSKSSNRENSHQDLSIKMTQQENYESNSEADDEVDNESLLTLCVKKKLLAKKLCPTSDDSSSDSETDNVPITARLLCMIKNKMVDLENLTEIENQNGILEKESKLDSGDDRQSSTSPKHILDKDLGMDSSLKRQHSEPTTDINTKKLKSATEQSGAKDSEEQFGSKITKKKVKKRLKKLSTNQLEDMMAEIAVEYLTTNKSSLGKMRQEMLSYKAEMIKYEQEFLRLKELHSDLASELRECTEWAETNNPPIRHKKVRNVGVQKNISSKSFAEPTQKNPQQTKATNAQNAKIVNMQRAKIANAQRAKIMNGQQAMMANAQQGMMANGQQAIRMNAQQMLHMTAQQKVVLNAQQSMIGNAQQALQPLLVKRACIVNAVQTKYINGAQTPHMNTQQMKHMNAQDSSQRQMSHPRTPMPMQSTLKLPPPRLFLKVEGDLKGIYVTWTFNGSLQQHAPIHKYQLFVDPLAAKVNPIWKKIGDIDPKPLPMKCTITYNKTFTTDQRYHFKLRAIDVNNREGEFSNTGSICISSYGISY